MVLQDSTRKTTNRLSCSIFRDTFRVSIAVVRIFSMKFRPLHDRVLVRPVEQEEKTAGGIIIPDTAKEKPMEGKVVAIGPGPARRTAEFTRWTSRSATGCCSANGRGP